MEPRKRTLKKEQEKIRKLERAEKERRDPLDKSIDQSVNQLKEKEKQYKVRIF